MLLFLDYDGVLHPDAAYLIGGRPVLKSDGELFMWAPVLVDLLQPYPELKIVLSTSWVRVLGYSRARDYLPQAIREKVIGGTWHSAMRRHAEGSHRTDASWFTESSRYQQISRYISRADRSAGAWLAIDDDSEGWPDAQRERLVETNGKTGLSSSLAQSELQSKLRFLQEEWTRQCV